MTRQLWVKVLLLLLLCANLSVFKVSALPPPTILFVDPSPVTANVGETFTVYAKVQDVTNLYSLDIQFGWGAAVLEYVAHEPHIPWLEKGDGVLWDPVIISNDIVDAVAGTYRLTALSYGTAQSYNSSDAGGVPGVVFEMTFRVKHTGETDIYFAASTLVNKQAGNIEHQVMHGYFEMQGLGDAPIADFAYSPEISVINRTAIAFNGTLSSDPDLEGIAYYLWNWGDGSARTNTTNPIADHTYSGVGVQPYWEFTVRLSVVDVEGSQSKTISKTVTVSYPSPVAKFTTVPSPNIRRELYVQTLEDITFDASESYDPDEKAGDPSGGIVEYKWDWATWTQGDINTTTTSDPITHRNYSYVKPAGFQVSLSVKDTEGRSSSPALPVTIFVSEQALPPVAKFDYSPKPPLPNEEVTFNASSSYDLDGTITLYTWDFGDGNHGNGIAVTHTYDSSGNYDVNLTVTDNEGLSDTEIKPVTVASERTGIYQLTAGGVVFSISITSNSTVFNVALDESQKMISFNVTGLVGTKGFARIAVPLSAMWGPWTILVDDAAPLYSEQTTNSTHSIVYLTYNHSAHTVTLISTGIVPEFPFTAALLGIAMMVTAIGIIIGRKRATKSAFK